MCGIFKSNFSLLVDLTLTREFNFKGFQGVFVFSNLERNHNTILWFLMDSQIFGLDFLSRP